MPHSLAKQLFYFLILGLVKFYELFTLPFRQKKWILIATNRPLMVERSIFLARHLKKNVNIKIAYCLTEPEEFTSEELDSLEAEFTIISYQKARFIKWDTILFPSHTKRFRDDVTKIYIDHGVTVNKCDPSGRMLMVGEQPWDDKGKYVYDKVFVESKYHEDIIGRAYGYMQEKLTVVGCLYSKYIISSTKSRNLIFAENGLNPEKETIVILSTWGKSLLDSQGEQLLKILPQLCKTYNVVFSVHPISAHKRSYRYNPLCEKFVEFAANNQNFSFFSNAGWVNLLPHADIVITDHTSACCYSLPFIKVLIFVDFDELDGVWKECAIRELRKLSTTVSNLDNLINDIKLESAKNKKPQYTALAKKVFGDYHNVLENYERQICL